MGLGQAAGPTASASVSELVPTQLVFDIQQRDSCRTSSAVSGLAQQVFEPSLCPWPPPRPLFASS
jgi:hypothetical protein